ncbi:MAG: hypothetical protein QUV05_00360 [Phycisphaerae bacterium]|nr:hypothetical protein [Phycisphaerae bacterium]
MREQKRCLQPLCACAVVIVTGFVAATVIAAVTFDGTVHSGVGEEWAEAESTAVQDNYTGYGDQVWNDPAVVGSELDELYARTDGTYLYVGVTGNLQSDGNAIVLLLDTDLTAGIGQNTLVTEVTPVVTEMPCSSVGPPFAVPNLGQALATNDNGTPSDPSDDLTIREAASTGTVLDGGFEPDHAIAVDTFGGTVHVTQYDLYATSLGDWDDPGTNNGATPCFDRIETLPYYATRVYRGEVAVDSNDGALTGGTNPNGSQYAFNNQGTSGVTATAVAAPGSGLPGDPRTQTQGLEAKIHLADLGYTLPLTGDLTIRMSVLLIGGGGLVSNQSLPGTARGTNQTHLDFRPDYTGITGNQYATVTRSAQAFSPNIDGMNTVSEFGLTNLVASQDTVTSFLDRTAVCTYLTDGSELDELYLRTDGNYLYVGLTGNLQENANAQIILLDVASGGQNVLATEISPDATAASCPGNGPPGAVQGLGQALIRNVSNETIRDPTSTGTRLEAGFSPDYAIAIDTDGGWLHVTQYDLSAAVLGQWNDPYTPDPQAADCISTPIEQLDYYATRVFRGEVQINSSSGALSNGTNPNVSEFAYNNTGTAGVTGESASAPPAAGSGLPGDPRSQTRGLEAKISLADLGLTPPISGDLVVKVAVLLTAPDGYVSNQTLPGVQNGNDHTTNLGPRPDFTTVTGTQYTQAILTPGTFSPTLDGRDIVTEFGASNVVASQDTVTSYGDRVQAQCQPVLAGGSELDQIFVQDGPGNLTIDIAMTGNLEANGNQLVLFLDTVVEGEFVLDGNADMISGMVGDTIPLEADFALVVNITGSDVWVDLINLQTNQKTFIGQNLVNSGEGVLELGGVPVPDWQVAINNTNVVGVNNQSADDPVNNPLDIQPNNALTAATGFEISIPGYAVGSPFEGDPICLFAMVTNSYAGWLSNQFLPAGLGGGRGNYDDGIDDLAAAGYSCLSTYIGPPPPACPDPRYDADRDGDVDQVDFAVLQTCYTGSGGGVAAGCECFDWNPATMEGDGDIDAEDYGLFEFCASGPGIPADQTCDDPLEP